MIKGTITKTDLVNLQVDKQKRINAQRNHSLTHLLHASLRKVFDNNVIQQGSFNNYASLHLDLSFGKDLNIKENLETKILEANNYAQNLINKNINCQIIYTNYQEAINKYHALAFFKDKYLNLNRVRIVKFNDQSIELCGGTHVANTKEIGIGLITSYKKIGVNKLRIYALSTAPNVNLEIKNKEQKLINLNQEIQENSQRLKLKNNNVGINLTKTNLINYYFNLKKAIKKQEAYLEKLKKIIQEQKLQQLVAPFLNLKPQLINNVQLLHDNFVEISKLVTKKIINFYRSNYLSKTIIFFIFKDLEAKTLKIFLIISKNLFNYSALNFLEHLKENSFAFKGGGNKNFIHIVCKNSSINQKIIQDL